VLDALVRQGLLGMPWRQQANAPAQIMYAISEEEVESEIARQRRLMVAVMKRGLRRGAASGAGATSQSGGTARHRMWCATCAIQFWQETTARHPWHESTEWCYWCHDCFAQRKRGRGPEECG
jgi:hypothetical protein